ncbi:MAG: hypothetical protein ABI679_04335 [Gemmatimonadota bacterium]
MKTLTSIIVLALLVASELPGQTVVRYDQGRRQINGFTLLQSVSDSNAYYYVPRFPRLARNGDGSFQLLLMKYVGRDSKTSGGLFHALVTFDLLPDQVDSLSRELVRQLPRARLVGSVPLTQTTKNGEELPNTFQVVSATFSDTAPGGFTRRVLTSGRAPVTPGSAAALAGLLSPEGATLLWSSFDGTTSDVSIALHAQYEAAINGYSATVVGEMNTIYQHTSEILNRQKHYSRRQLRDVVDSLIKRGTLRVDVQDLSAGLTINTKDMEALLQVVTDKLTTLMFDHENGWAKDPPQEVAVEADQLKGRQEEGFFAKVFGGGDTEYYTDDQYVMKSITDIQQRSFRLQLNKGSSVSVAVDASGNLSAFFTGLSDRARYFRVVNMTDADFETLPVTFQVDLGAVEAFQDLVNFVSVSVKKVYQDHPAFTASFQITPDDIKAGRLSRTIEIPRLGETGADWQEYQYRISWSLRGASTVSLPSQSDRWTASSDPAVSLKLPFERQVVEIDAARELFKPAGFESASAQFASVLLGHQRMQRQVMLRAGDNENTSRVVVYRDAGAPIAYRIQWHGAGGTREDGLALLTGTYLFLTPPGPAAPSPTPTPVTPGGTD